MLRVVAWMTAVALLLVLTLSPPVATPAPLAGALPWFVPVFGRLPWIVPALGLHVGLLVGLLGAVRASSRHASSRHATRWTTRFITLVVALALLVLPFGYPRAVVNAIATVAMDLSALFPSVVFVAALLYGLRAEAHANQATGRSEARGARRPCAPCALSQPSDASAAQQAIASYPGWRRRLSSARIPIGDSVPMRGE
jgi:hypothetical protein